MHYVLVLNNNKKLAFFFLINSVVHVVDYVEILNA
jgi:hypothetical protein